MGPALKHFDCPNGYNSSLLDKIFQASPGAKLIANFSNHREIQQIDCDATSGFFQLKFRGQTTRCIYTNTTAPQLMALLQELPVVGQVQVEYRSFHTRLCSTLAEHRANVTFLSHFGHEPLLEVVNSNLLGRPRRTTVTRLQASGPEGLFECAGNGHCNTDTGLCQCYERRGTSNGVGEVGDRGDCGRLLM